MFVVEIGAVDHHLRDVKQLVDGHRRSRASPSRSTLWLWFTVLFANFAEAMAEARGRAQADTLRATQKETPARRIGDAREETVSSSQPAQGRPGAGREGDLIPSDGEVIEGVAYVNEAAITGESAPVLKEPGTDIRSSVTGGTQVVSDWLTIRITADPGETFLDRMIALVEGAVRQRTPNEIALSILLAGLTIVFLLAVATLQPFAIYAGGPVSDRRPGGAAGLPDPDHHRRAAFRHRHRRHGPGDALQRAGHVRPGGGGRRRRGHAAARQDGDDHLRQPAGSRVHPGRRRQQAAELRRRPPVEPGRRHARGAQHPGAAPSSSAPPADAMASPQAPSSIPFTAETRLSGLRQRRHAWFKGRGRRDRGRRPVSGDQRRRSGRRGRAHLARGRHAAGARRDEPVWSAWST